MYRYIGDGAWIPGVPARDLTDEEADAAELVSPGVKQSAIYEYVSDREHPRLAARAEKAATGSPLVEPPAASVTEASVE